jgi:hypothetical protein
MKYLILKKRPDADEDPFTEMVAAGSAADFRFPFEVESRDLAEKDVGELRRDPNVQDAISLCVPKTSSALIS